jgi:DNA-binding MarR family transcriptional regulator
MEEMSKGVKIIRLFKQIMQSVKRNLGDSFRPLNLTGPQGMILGTLCRNGEMKISDLSTEVGLSNSTVSGIIDRLEKQGLAERKRSEEDRRVVYVDATDKFKKCSQEHFKEIEERVAVIMNEATTEELDKVLEGMEILKKIIERQDK